MRTNGGSNRHPARSVGRRGILTTLLVSSMGGTCGRGGETVEYRLVGCHGVVVVGRVVEVAYEWIVVGGTMIAAVVVG